MSVFGSLNKCGPQIPMDLIKQGFDDGAAKWVPDGPRVDHVQKLGYVNAPDQPFFSRDIGRSFQLGGRTYYLFGDTFCNDAGVSSNTCQVVPDWTRPKNAYYLSCDSHGFVMPLILLNSDEHSFLIATANENKRIAFWCFGGVVEVSPGIGWTWYQKHIIGPNGHDELCGVGVARISLNKDSLSGHLSCARMPGLMFEADQPLFGSFSALVEGDMVYLWGQKDGDVFLARVGKEYCHQWFHYEFWNGSRYVSMINEAMPVLQDLQQGQIFKSDLFGSCLPWVFIGVTKWADSKVMIGAASSIEGPWDIRPLFKAEGIAKPDAYQYCMYAHPWAANARQGQLLVSWCDPWPGGVILAKVTFDTHPGTHWATVPLESCSEETAYAVTNRAAEICCFSNVRYAALLNPRRLRLYSTDEKAVEGALNMVRHHMGLVIKEEASQSQVEMGRRRGSSLTGFLAKVLNRWGGEFR
ncbi:MAG: hypothetical protein LQ344_005973 [Seirophora lacunosa]|nr:MAG: hypothetical protein LQ344_005973 [Seirophora lacunosa]